MCAICVLERGASHFGDLAEYHPSMDRSNSNIRLFDYSAVPSRSTNVIKALPLVESRFQLGPSALAGFSLFILMVPIQERLMTYSHHRRRKANVWTDSRSKLIMEVLGAMRVVKYFTYESPFLKREYVRLQRVLNPLSLYVGIYDIRAKELKGIQGIRLTNALKCVQTLAHNQPYSLFRFTAWQWHSRFLLQQRPWRL